MRIMGIDSSSTGIGISLLDGNSLEAYFHRTFKHKNKYMRLIHISDFLNPIIELLKPDIIVVEIPYSPSRSGLSVLNMVLGIVFYCSTIKNGVEFVEAHPSSVQRACDIPFKVEIEGKLKNIPREMKKTMTIEYINRTYNLSLTEKEDDIADAIALAKCLKEEIDGGGEL